MNICFISTGMFGEAHAGKAGGVGDFLPLIEAVFLMSTQPEILTAVIHLVTVDVIHIAGMFSQQQPVQEHVPASAGYLPADISDRITSAASPPGTEAGHHWKVLGIDEEAVAIPEEDSYKGTIFREFISVSDRTRLPTKKAPEGAHVN